MGIVVLTGTLTFDREILGIAVGDGTLNPSDTLVGHPGAAFPTPPNGLRGWEFGFGDGAAPNTIDQITLSADRKTIDVVPRCNGLDQFRVITTVPEPATWLLMASAGAPLGIWRRFRSLR